MVPLVDVATTKNLISLFPNIKVVWAPNDQGKKSLARAIGEESLNRVGIAIYRTSISKDDSVSQYSRADRGVMHQLDQTNISYPDFVNNQRRKPIVIDYEISCWSPTLSGLNDVDRELSFFNVYAPITVTIDGMEFRFAFEEDSPSYSYTPNSRSDGILEYTFTKTIRVHTHWYKIVNYKLVHEMFFKFYDTMSTTGEISEELIETLNLVTTIN